MSTRPGSVFISYKREEAATAERLREALVEAGFTVWWDEDLQCGQAWAERIDQAVRSCACLIVLWSERAAASQWVKYEAAQAMAREVYAPARIELVNLESPYDRIQATDLIGWDGDRQHAGFGNLLQRVDELVPAPVPVALRIGRWLRANLSTLTASAIASAAMVALGAIVIEQRSTSQALASALRNLETVSSIVETVSADMQADRREKVYDCSASRELRVELAMEMYSKGRDLDQVCLAGANLNEADLAGANLALANLAGAALTGADLNGANLSGADLLGVDLRWADLTDAELHQAQLDSACGLWPPVNLPEGLVWRSRSCPDLLGGRG